MAEAAILVKRKKYEEGRNRTQMKGLEKIIPLDGRDIKVVLQKFAPQAAGSLLISSGETAVLVTANRAAPREGI